MKVTISHAGLENLRNLGYRVDDAWIDQRLPEVAKWLDDASAYVARASNSDAPQHVEFRLFEGINGAERRGSTILFGHQFSSGLLKATSPNPLRQPNARYSEVMNEQFRQADLDEVVSAMHHAAHELGHTLGHSWDPRCTDGSLSQMNEAVTETYINDLFPRMLAGPRQHRFAMRYGDQTPIPFS